MSGWVIGLVVAALGVIGAAVLAVKAQAITFWLWPDGGEDQ